MDEVPSWLEGEDKATSERFVLKLEETRMKEWRGKPFISTFFSRLER